MGEEALVACSALGRVVRPGDHGNLISGPRVVLAELPTPGMVSVIARAGKAEAVVAAARAAFAVNLPLGPHYVIAGGIIFIWSGPRRWLALAYNLSSEELVVRLSPAFGGLASLTEQGDGRAVIRVGGVRARDTLAKILTIDLHPRSFHPGDTAITGAAHLELQIWQLDDVPNFEITLFRGFASSFWGWLTESAAEFGYHIAATPGDISVL